ncbi:MAG TPA: tetratricopeptide repeat protein [Gemmatimonadaceae bacterium]|nr:tetratricopeptide repeat protein [Gemmatimonadaceae bacterium]
MHSVRARTWIVIAALAMAPGMSAQAARPESARPKLDAGADTNEAHAYYLLGTEKIFDKKPEEAAKAFYWATRLDPASGDYLYAYREASFMAMPIDKLLAYGNRSSKKPRDVELLRLDTLLYRALLAKPFLFRRFDELVTQHVIDEQVKRVASVVGRTVVEMNMDQAVHMDILNAYSKGAYSSAAALYAEPLKNKKIDKKMHEIIDPGIHAERSRLFFLMDNMDSARTEMIAAIEGRRARDSTRVVFLYESSTLYEQSLGMIYERQKNFADARKAYESALVEDLSNYEAHARLSQLQLAGGDTVAAMTEMNLAVQIVPDDPVLHYEYALELVQTRHDAPASDQLRKAIAADSFYAAPHLLLAVIAGVEQYDDQALAEYQRFVALAARTDPQEKYAEDQIAKLSSKMASTSPKQ